MIMCPSMVSMSEGLDLYRQQERATFLTILLRLANVVMHWPLHP